MARRDDSGMAMITALLVSFVVLILALTAVQITDHVLSGVRLDRKRVFAFHAAEAGLDRALLVVQTTSFASLPCAAPLTGSLVTEPGTASYSVRFTYYSAFPPSGSPLACPLTSAAGGVLISSTGDTSDRVGGSRRLELAAKLTPAAGGGFTRAIFSDASIDFDNSLVLGGNIGNDAVLYTNGNYNCDNSQTLNGYVFAQGSANMSNSCRVLVDVWARNAVTLQNSINVGRDVMSSTSSVTFTNSITVGRNVVAGTTVSLGNSPTIGGQVIQNNVQPSPPQETFPAMPYEESAWTSAGYDIREYGTNCDGAVTALDTQAQNWTLPTVVRISGCTLTFSNSIQVDMRNNIAIVNDGEAFDLVNSITFRRASNGVADPKLYLIVPTGSSCAAPSPADITLRNSISFVSPVLTFLYSPCLISLGNSGQMLGQVYGGRVLIRNSVNIAYRPMGVVPGVGTSGTTVTDIGVAYKREVPG